MGPSRGLTLEEPTADGQPLPELAIATITQAQVAGYVDPSWDPHDLLVTLFGIALAWAHFPDPAAATTSPAILAYRRAAAVEAATRVISPPRTSAPEHHPPHSAVHEDPLAGPCRHPGQVILDPEGAQRTGDPEDEGQVVDHNHDDVGGHLRPTAPCDWKFTTRLST